MKLIALAATMALLVFGAAPAFAGESVCGTTDGDTDGLLDCEDNCSDDYNPDQDDTDSDDCGNICDADYENDGTTGFLDFGAFGAAFGTTSALHDHTEPVGVGVVGFLDFGRFGTLFGQTAGPSGTVGAGGTPVCRDQ